MLGVWLMAAPAVLGSIGAMRTNDQVVGPLVVSAAIIALSEVTRPVRWVNVPLGLWLVVAPWLLGAEQLVLVNSMVVGFLLMGFATVRGDLRHSVGGGWAALWRSNTAE